MATKTIPEHTVKACDVCGTVRQYLTECPACGREYCFMCDGIYPGCGIAPDVCKNCPKHKEVAKICDKYSAKFSKLVDTRAAEIAALRDKKTDA